MKEKDCLKELRAIKDGTFATVDEKGCPQAKDNRCDAGR